MQCIPQKTLFFISTFILGLSLTLPSPTYADNTSDCNHISLKIPPPAAGRIDYGCGRGDIYFKDLLFAMDTITTSEKNTDLAIKDAKKNLSFLPQPVTMLKDVQIKDKKYPGYCAVFREEPFSEEDFFQNPFYLSCILKVARNGYITIATVAGGDVGSPELDKAIEKEAKKRKVIADINFSLEYLNMPEKELKKEFPLIYTARNKTKVSIVKALNEAIPLFAKIARSVKIKAK